MKRTVQSYGVLGVTSWHSTKHIGYVDMYAEGHFLFRQDVTYTSTTHSDALDSAIALRHDLLYDYDQCMNSDNPQYSHHQ